MMTTVDYVKLAAGFRRSEPAHGRQWNSLQRGAWCGWVRALRGTIDVLKADNPRFSETLFLRAACRDPELVTEHFEWAPIWQKRAGVA